MIRTVMLAPGMARAYVDGEWAGALVVLACGRLELEASDGRRVHLRSGAVLWLAGLPLRALHNRGSAPAVLIVVTREDARRRRPAEPADARRRRQAAKPADARRRRQAAKPADARRRRWRGPGMRGGRRESSSA